MFADEFISQLSQGINAYNHPMPSDPALEAAMLDDFRWYDCDMPSGPALEAAMLDGFRRITGHMPSGPALEAAMLESFRRITRHMPSGPALVAALLDRFRQITRHLPSGSAREAVMLDYIRQFTSQMLLLSAFTVEKPASAIMDRTETPESCLTRVGQYGPWTPPMLHGPARNAAKFANPKADWKEIHHAYIVVVDLPGLDKDQVKLEVEKDRILSISGVWSSEKLEEEDKNYTRLYNERSSGEFLRRFELPEDAKMDHIRATMWNGVLTVTVPKEKAKIIKIFDGAKMDQNDVLSVKTIDKGIDKGKGVMGIVIGQATKRD